MTTSANYDGLARNYVTGARGILTPAATPADRERGVGAPSDLSARATELLPVSADLNAAAASKLKSATATVRAQAEAQLLSKAVTDLQVSSQLLRAAQDQQAGVQGGASAVGERGLDAGMDSEANFRVLLGEPIAAPSGERGFVLVGDRDSALKQLTTDVTDAVSQLIERAAGASQKSVEGILGVGVAKLFAGAAAVSFDVANILGAGEKFALLAQQAKDFVQRAYDALRAIVGDALLGMGMDKLKDFLSDLKSKEKSIIDDGLKRLYDTPALTKALKATLADTKADIPKMGDAHDAVLKLNAEHQARMDTVGKVYGLLKLVPLLAAFGFPQVQLALGVGYLLVAGYVVFATADYLDADTVKQLNFIPGLKAQLDRTLA